MRGMTFGKMGKGDKLVRWVKIDPRMAMSEQKKNGLRGEKHKFDPLSSLFF